MPTDARPPDAAAGAHPRRAAARRAIVWALAALLAAALAWTGARMLGALRPYPDSGAGLFPRPDDRPLFGQQSHATRWPKDAFDAERFAAPPLRDRPQLRWQWPDNSPPGELATELAAIAAMGFGGVLLPTADPHWNTAAHCAPGGGVDGVDGVAPARSAWREALGRAAADGLALHWVVDTDAPLAAATASVAEDGMLALVASEQDVSGQLKDGQAQAQTLALPAPRPRQVPRLARALRAAWTGSPPRVGGFHPASRQLLGVVAARAGQRGELDAETLVDVSAHASSETLRYAFGPGQWRVVALWQVASAERGGAHQSGPVVVNVLDGARTLAAHDCLFGARIEPRGHVNVPLAGVGVGPHRSRSRLSPLSGDFLAAFRSRRGYDPMPWLAAAVGSGGLFVGAQRAAGRYRLGGDALDERLRYDYRLTVSDLYAERFVSHAKLWASSHGIAHRVTLDPVGMDGIHAAGSADVPEARPDGDDALPMQLVAAGAQMKNRPLVAGAALAFHAHRYAITPDDIKRAADRLLINGANQISLHRLPLPLARYPFHAAQTSLNRYLARMQYLMRRGPRQIDVLIYYPWLGLPGPAGSPAGDRRARRWLAAQQPLIEQLERRGIRWAWINDRSLRGAVGGAEQAADSGDSGDSGALDGDIVVGGRRHAGLLISDAPFMQQLAAWRLHQMHRAGANIRQLGAGAERQAGLRLHAAGDDVVRRAMRAIGEASVGQSTAQWIAALQRRQRLALAAPQPGLRRLSRSGPGGETIDVFQNDSSASWTFKLSIKDQADWRGRLQFWLEPASGDIQRATWPLQRRLAAHSLVALLSMPRRPAPDAARARVPAVAGAKSLPLTRWRLRDAEGRALARAGPLRDLSTRNATRHRRGVVYYASEFSLDDPAGWTLHLGNLRGSAEVHVNRRRCGAVSLRPWTLPLDGCLRAGANTIEIALRLANHNHYLGLAWRGADDWAAALDWPLLPSGLLGPVALRR